ncbi:hypothetical protein SDRG_02385, partial [Saprolegnia diclina VS20]
WLRNLLEAGHLPIVEIMPLPPTTYAIIGASTILPSLCIGYGAGLIGKSLAEKSTGRDAVIVRPLDAVLFGITAFVGCKITGDAALRRFTPRTPTAEAIFSVVKPNVSQTIFVGALIAGAYVFHVVGAMPVRASTSSSMATSSKD